MLLLKTILISLYLYIKFNSKENGMLLGLINLIILFILILLLPIKIHFKIILILIYYFIFKINLYFLYWLIIIINKSYQGFYKNQNNDLVLRSEVTFLFSNSFNLITNFEMLPSFPSIIVSNYCYDRLENFSCIIIPKDLSIIMDVKTNQIARLDSLVNSVIIRNGENKNNYNFIKNQIKSNINKENLYLFMLINVVILKKGYIGKLRSGIFNIAKELNIPITPICIDYIDNYSGIICKKQNFFMKVGDTILIKNVKETMENVKQFYRKTLLDFRKNKYSVTFKI